MTLLELVKHLRISILDDVGGTNVVWEDLAEDDVEAAQLRWSNEELTAYINEAQNRACRASYLIKKAESDFDIAVTAGTAIYQLDTRIIRLKNVEIASVGKSLIPVEYEDLMNIRNWRIKQGTPDSYVIDESDKQITLYPIPLVDDTLSLIYYRLPLLTLDWGSSSNDLEIPSEYQLEMLDYAAHMAYLKDEANTFDPQRAEYYRKKFITNFTDTSVYGELRRKRSKGRTVRYRDVL